MRFLSTFRIATVIATTLVVSGCGSTETVKPLNTSVSSKNVTDSKSVYNGTSTNATSSTSNASQTSNFFIMSPSQLANYEQVHGGPAPFSGTHMKRVPKNEVQSIIPNGYLLKPVKTKFMKDDYSIADAWTGDLENKQFYLAIYSNKKTGDIVVGIKYDNQLKTASLIKSQKYVIKNFTGRFVIFGVPYIEGPFYAYDLTTGNVVNPGMIVDQMSGDFPVQGAGGPLWIQGLDKKYPFKQ